MINKNYRIGNFVYGVDEGYEETAMEISALQEDDTFRLKHGESSVGCYRSRLIKPIPLSEEWLIKFGFHEMYSHKGYYIKGEITMESEDFIFHLKSGFIQANSALEIHPIGVKIDKVHDLQNAFKVLMGKELTIGK